MVRARSGIAALIVAALLHASCAKPHDPDYQVRAHLLRDGRDIILVYENASNAPLCMPEVSYADSRRSGTGVYLYDPKRNDIQEAFALVTWAPGSERECRTVMPGESLTLRRSLDHLLRHFPDVPECYYLVTVYRRIAPEGLVASEPSRPLWVCYRPTGRGTASK